MFEIFGRVLAFFYELIPSYGVAIMLLTTAVMLLAYPLTAKGTRSMLAMQRIQPEIKKLQQLHKGDRAKLNEEIMALYRHHGVNPVSGCLPLLLQMPVFIILYSVIRGLTHAVITGFAVVSLTGSSANANIDDVPDPVDLRGAKLEEVRVEGNDVEHGVIADAKVNAVVVVRGDEVGKLKDARVRRGCAVDKSSKKPRSGGERDCDAGGNTLKPVKVVNVNDEQIGQLKNVRVEGGRVDGDPKYVDKSSSLYGDLKEDGGSMPWLGIDLADSANDAHSSFWAAIPFYVLLALMVVTQYIQQWQLQSRRKGQQNSAQAQQMQQIQKFLPPFFGFIGLGFPAGVVVYWVTQNVLRIGQQWVMYRFDTRPAEETAATKAEIAATIAEDTAAARKPKRQKKKKKGR